MRSYPQSMSKDERALFLEWAARGMYAAYQEASKLLAPHAIETQADQLATEAGYSDHLHALVSRSWQEGYQTVKAQAHEQQLSLARVVLALPYQLALSRLLVALIQA